MARWEMDRVAKSLADQYGDAGFELFDIAFKQGGYSEWKGK